MVDDEVFSEFFRRQVSGSDRFTRRMVIKLGKYFGLHPRSVVERCERLGLCKRGSWDWFQANGGITKAHVDQVTSDDTKGGTGR